MKKIFIFILIPFLSYTQKNVFLSFNPVFTNQPFQLQTVYTGNNGQEVTLDYFNYYLGDINLIHDGGQVLNLSETVYLIDPLNHTIYLGFQNVTNIEQVNFLIGVPKRFNTQAGALAQDISSYPLSSALSFQSPSMYWGWTSGYTHMITGGMADGNNDQIPESYFELHNLGNNNQQMVNKSSIIQTNTNAAQIDVVFNCHIDRWLNNINLATADIVHGETGTNMLVMQNVNTQNVFDQPAEAGIFNASPSTIQFSSQQGAILCSWIGVSHETPLVLLDQSGREVQRAVLQNATGIVKWTSLTQGMYFVQYTDIKGRNQSQQVFVF